MEKSEAWKIAKWKNGKFWKIEKKWKWKMESGKMEIVGKLEKWKNMENRMVPYGTIMVPYGTIWCHKVP